MVSTVLDKLESTLLTTPATDGYTRFSLLLDFPIFSAQSKNLNVAYCLPNIKLCDKGCYKIWSFTEEIKVQPYERKGKLNPKTFPWFLCSCLVVLY